ncbi:MAG TPA: ISAs1 family transposase, partial [Desulfobacteraceae bacterium]|nr:ISAs1 family transposase [Desulfobacteraceae bacterium]
MLKSFLSEIKDNRRKEGKRYKPGDILLFSIFAIHGGAVSHRKILMFIKGHYEVLNEKFGHERKRLPAYTTI